MYSEKIQSIIKHYLNDDLVIIETMGVVENYNDLQPCHTIIRFHDNDIDELLYILENFKNAFIVFDNFSFWIKDYDYNQISHLSNKLSHLARRINSIICM